MEQEEKTGNSPATLPTPPTLNLMEQLLLAKMEKQSLREDEGDSRGGRSSRSIPLRRADSMDSQASASTCNSVWSSDSASSSNLYCKCDDCLLGIVDEHQRAPPSLGRKKVTLSTLRLSRQRTPISLKQYPLCRF